MRYHYKAKRMPIINGTIKQNRIDEKYHWIINSLRKASEEQQFEEGDELYIEVMDKFVEVKFLSDGNFA